MRRLPNRILKQHLLLKFVVLFNFLLLKLALLLELQLLFPVFLELFLLALVHLYYLGIVTEQLLFHVGDDLPELVLLTLLLGQLFVPGFQLVLEGAPLLVCGVAQLARGVLVRSWLLRQ